MASTFNEALLIEQMLKKVQEPKARLALLGNYLEGVKGTVFRQTQFAEFELRMHEMAQKGEPLTGDALSKLYLEITRKYYGHDQKIAIVDDYVAHEWAYITHFYSPFYVFQYATSFTASTALSEKVLERVARCRQALPDVPGLGRIEVPDRPAEGRRRRHDDQRAARPDDREDEPRDGRDGEAAQELTIDEVEQIDEDSKDRLRRLRRSGCATRLRRCIAGCCSCCVSMRCGGTAAA